MNLTITVDPEVLKRARIRAIGEDTSVNAVLREHLTTYADMARPLQRVVEEAAREQREAIESLIRLSRTPRPVAAAHQGTRDESGNRTWKRDDLYGR